jgi:hypothetical protein
MCRIGAGWVNCDCDLSVASSSIPKKQGKSIAVLTSNNNHFFRLGHCLHRQRLITDCACLMDYQQ